MQVTVLEKKGDPGEKLHTTGIIVKDAIDQITLLDGLIMWRLPPVGGRPRVPDVR